VSGSFKIFEDLAEQLQKDIRFYREQHLHTSRIDIFSTVEENQRIVPQLNDKQIAFLSYDLFIDILPKTESLKFMPEDLEEISDILFSRKEKEIARYIDQLNEDNNIVKKIEEDPKFSQIVLRLHQLNELNHLLILQKPLIDIQNHVLKSTDIPKSLSVYVAKIISDKDLEMIRSDDDKFISIGIFVLATKSLLTARTIARKMADNGLISVVFQVDIPEGTHFLEIDSDRIIFRLGPVFYLESINRAPDSVWYAKIKYAHSEFRCIKKQVQFEIDIPLSWLTYGTYLYFLKQHRLGEIYFEYFLKKLSGRHIVHRVSIYNNMALMYTMENGKHGQTKAKTICNNALEYTRSVNSNSTTNGYEGKICVTPPTANATSSKSSIDRSIVLAKLANVYDRTGDYKLAAEYYKEAVILATDGAVVRAKKNDCGCKKTHINT
jgi:hypothetical protein